MATSLTPGENKLREAGLLEKFHLIRVDGGFDTCVVSAVKYTGPPLTRPSILRALRHIVNTHAALSVYATSPPPPTGTTKTNDKKHDPFEINFHRLPNVLVDDVLTLDAHSGKTLEEALHAELEKPPPKLVKEGVKTETEFERPKPLWRVSILDDKQTVIFALHHAIGDGASGFALQRTFLDGLNGPSTDVDEVEEGTIIDPPTDLHLTPPIESRTSVAVTWRTFFSIMYQTFAPKSWLKGYAAWTGNLVGSSTDAPVAPDTRVQVRLRKIEGEEGKKLVKLCRKNGTTVTAFLHTLGVAVWSDVLRTSKDAGLESEIGMRWKTLSTSIPVSLRRFTGATPFEMCDHVSNYHFYPSIRADDGSADKETFPWEEAQKLAKELKSGLEGTKQVVGTIRYMFSLGIAWGFFKGQVGKKRNYTFEVSNVGVLPKSQAVAIGQGKAQWDAEEVWHAQNDGVCGAAVKMNVAGASESGTIAIVYTWGEGAVDTSLADRFVEGVHEGIRAILEGE